MEEKGTLLPTLSPAAIGFPVVPGPTPGGNVDFVTGVVSIIRGVVSVVPPDGIFELKF